MTPVFNKAERRQVHCSRSQLIHDSKILHTACNIPSTFLIWVAMSVKVYSQEGDN